MPANGWKADVLERKETSLYRARKIHEELSDKIATVICPGNPSFHSKNALFDESKSFDSIKHNLFKLVLLGGQPKSITAHSIIAPSLQRKEAIQLVEE